MRSVLALVLVISAGVACGESSVGLVDPGVVSSTGQDAPGAPGAQANSPPGAPVIPTATVRPVVTTTPVEGARTTVLPSGRVVSPSSETGQLPAVSTQRPSDGPREVVSELRVSPTVTSTQPANLGTQPDTPTPAGQLDPVLFGISIHVEGWDGEVRHRHKFEAHRDAMIRFAEEVSAGGGVLTFELSNSFIEAVAVWDDSVLARLVELGHHLALHADVGGRGRPGYDLLASALGQMRERLSHLGVETTHVSGVCSRGPWVEAALAAGFTSTGGAVAYCATSMDADLLGDNAGWIEACRTPTACHGPPPVEVGRRFHPFHAESSADWMVSDAVDGLLIVVSESGHPLPCLGPGETAGTGACHADMSDLEVVVDAIDLYVDARRHDVITALAYSWSLGPVPADGIGEALVNRLAPYVDTGQITWVGVDDIEHYVDGEMVAGAAPGVVETSSSESERRRAGQNGMSFMVSIHAHLRRDWQPYTTPAMVMVDRPMLREAMSALSALQVVLDTHRIPANFQFSYGLARALCTYVDGQGFVRGLGEAGHEVGIHTHGHRQVDRAYRAVADGCGVTPAAASGIQFSIGTANDPARAAAVWLRAVESAGVVTVIGALGMEGSPMNGVCRDYGGVRRNAEANALLHSWRIVPSDLCTAVPRGSLTVVTHTDTGIGSRSGMNTEVGNIRAATFGRWTEEFTAAIEGSTSSSTWGIVGALPQMMGPGGLDEQFATAFDAFLARVADAAVMGAVVPSTASQAAARVQ